MSVVHPVAVVAAGDQQCLAHSQHLAVAAHLLALGPPLDLTSKVLLGDFGRSSSFGGFALYYIHGRTCAVRAARRVDLFTLCYLSNR